MNDGVTQKRVIFLTISAWILDGFAHHFLLKSFGYEISFVPIYFVVAISWLIGIFTFIPGNLGVREVIYTSLFSVFSVPPIVSFSSVLIHRVILLIIFFTGAIFSGISLLRVRAIERYD